MYKLLNVLMCTWICDKCSAVKATNVCWLIGSPSQKSSRVSLTWQARWHLELRSVKKSGFLLGSAMLFGHHHWSQPWGKKKTNSWGTIQLVCTKYSLPGLWKSNLCSILLKLAPQTEVPWKMLSFLSGFSRQNFPFALLQRPVSQSVPAVWHVHWAMLKPILRWQWKEHV